MGAAQARATARHRRGLRFHQPTTPEERIHGNHTAIRREGSGARPRRRAADCVGRPADAGARGDPRALRARAAARRAPHLRVSARDDRDGEPRPHAVGGRRRCRALRVQPALDAGRRRGCPRRRVRRRRVRDQGRGQRHVLPPHRGRGRSPSAPDDGRRRRRDRRAPLGPPRAARRRDRRHGGDDHWRDPAQGSRARRQARLSR